MGLWHLAASGDGAREVPDLLGQVVMGWLRVHRRPQPRATTSDLSQLDGEEGTQSLCSAPHIWWAQCHSYAGGQLAQCLGFLGPLVGRGKKRGRVLIRQHW